jgi:enolase
MKDYLGIQSVHALEVLDSRGNPTVQVEVVTEGGFSGLAIVPSGASTGSFEAVELRDQDENRYSGKGVLDAVENVNSKIAKKMIGMNVYDQRKIDNFLIDLDKTPNKANLGANAILGVSLACCRAASSSLGTPLYSYIGGVNAHVLPTPMMNILNGGKHSDNNLSIQEFMIVPSGGKTFAEKLEMGVTVYHTLKKLLKSKNLSTSVGDEGGFAPNLQSHEEALDLIVKAIEKSNYKVKQDIGIALDVAATEMFDEAKKQGKDGYLFWKTGEFKTKGEMIDYLDNLTNNYPIVSIEDGLAELNIKEIREPNVKKEEIRIVVASLRLDAIVAELANCSRNVANEIIENQRVFINYENEFRSSKLLSEGDVIVIRGKGKFIVKLINGETRKGKLSVTIEHYI